MVSPMGRAATQTGGDIVDRAEDQVSQAAASCGVRVALTTYSGRSTTAS